MFLIRILSVILGGLLLAACSAYSYKPVNDDMADELQSPEQLKPYRASVTTETVLSSTAEDMKARIDSWFSAEGDDFRVVYQEEVDDCSSGLTFVSYMLTLGILPYIEDCRYISHFEIYGPDGHQVFAHEEPYNTRRAMSFLGPMAYLWSGLSSQDKNRDMLNRHKASLNIYLQAEEEKYRQVTAAGSAQAYRTYLQEYPGSFYYRQALAALAATTPEGDALSFHLANAAVDPQYIELLPATEQLWFVGPEGMKVYQVAELAKNESEALLTAQIQAAHGVYRVFNAGEIRTLKSMGIPDSVIAAMINVSAAPSAAVARAGNGQADEYQGASGSGNQAADIAAECAKRYAALKACDQLPLGSGICRTQVENSYSHVICDLVDAVTD